MNSLVMISLRLVLLLGALVVGVCHAVEIQKWVDAEGVTHYGASSPQGVTAKKVKAAARAGSTAEASEAVVLYSTAWCGYCKRARAYMNAKGIDYRDYDIEKDAIALRQYQRQGGVGVPFLVKGDSVLRGFSARKYDRFFTTD